MDLVVLISSMDFHVQIEFMDLNFISFVMILTPLRPNGTVPTVRLQMKPLQS